MTDTPTKECNKCEEVKEYEAFYLNFLSQMSPPLDCKICKTINPGTQDFAVDHDHARCPGKQSCGECVRGILCNPCNQAIGLMSDNPATLRLAAEYLESNDLS